MNVLVREAWLEDAVPNPHSSFCGHRIGTECPAVAGTASAPNLLSARAAQGVGALRLHRQGREGSVRSWQLCLWCVANRILPAGISAVCRQALHLSPALRACAMCRTGSYLCKTL